MRQPPQSSTLDQRLRLLAQSYERLTGKSLLTATPAQQAALHDALWNAPRIIVAHGTESDPVFFYGNQQALNLFEMSFAEFICLPSRLSAESVQRDERERLLGKVARQGYVDDYCGVRISASGRRFMINAATVWNLIDEPGQHHGQAATFTDWHYIED